MNNFNFLRYHKTHKIMMESEIIREAYRASGLSQIDFAEKIGKSQAQISKYLSGTSSPKKETIIHCVNILKKESPNESDFFNLLFEVLELKEEKHREFRFALTKIIKAYKSNT